AYENLTRQQRRPEPKSKDGRPAPQAASSGNAPVAQAIPLVRRALKILADREVSPQTGLLKSTLLQLDSTFSERNYGASSFLDFVEKLAKEGVVTLKHAGRSVMVELNPSAPEDDAPRGARSFDGAQGRPPVDLDESVPTAPEAPRADEQAPVQATESAA